MKKSIARIAILMAVVSCLSAGKLIAAGHGTRGPTAGTTTNDLAQLAAELAQKAEQLDQYQKSLEAQRDREADSDRTTFRWVGDLDTEAGAEQSEQESQEESLDVSVAYPAQVAPRPAASAYQEQVSNGTDAGNSKVVFAQASEDVFDSAESLGDAQDFTESTTSQQADTWNDPLLGSGCCDACCGGCCDSCCGGGCCCPRCCRRPCTIIAGTEAVFLAPDINGRRVNYLYNDATFGATPYYHQFGPYWGDAAVDDFYIAPRIWLGVQGCRWGVVGRYFHMRVGENDFDRDPGGTYWNQAFNASSVFEAYATDIEVTRNFCIHGCKNQLSFGARYAAIDFNEQLYSRSVVPGLDPNGLSGLLDGGARSNRYARGTGLTFGLNGRKPLFCNSCAHWFYSARSSILWGSNYNDVETRASVVATPNGGAIVGAASTIDNAAVHVDDDLFIGEFQLGIQWDFCLRCLPAKAFFRTAFEYQYWDASSGFAEAGSVAGVRINDGGDISDYDVATSAQAPGLIVDMYGLAIATGFTW